jgi:Putative transposase
MQGTWTGDKDLTESINDEKAMDNLARYIVRASFSQERMTYVPEESKVLYQSKDGKVEKAFDALDGLAAMCTQVSNKGEYRVMYYGHFSNGARRKKKKENQDEWVGPGWRGVIELGRSGPEFSSFLIATKGPHPAWTHAICS